jgi:hypothetical protein
MTDVLTQEFGGLLPLEPCEIRRQIERVEKQNDVDRGIGLGGAGIVLAERDDFPRLPVVDYCEVRARKLWDRVACRIRNHDIKVNETLDVNGTGRRTSNAFSSKSGDERCPETSRDRLPTS